MLTIGLLYLGASVSFLFERKFLWAVIALSWGIGNLALAYLATDSQECVP
jgi:hypothetical protein